MVEAFIKHVLDVNSDHLGLYGDTSAYYRTMEQQGRLTLHLHMFVWVAGGLTPQEIRDCVMDKNSDFCTAISEYLDSVCVGQFLTSMKDEVGEKVQHRKKTLGYVNQTKTMPDKVPLTCDMRCGTCGTCTANYQWWNQFNEITDDLLWRFNVHQHKIEDKDHNRPGCLNPKGKCKAWFPRTLFDRTVVSEVDGRIDLKKHEAWLNTFTPELTYLLQSNSDVTCLLSGTAIKAVVAYVTDYITQQSLKTYSIFDTVKSIFDQDSDILGGSEKCWERARKLFSHIVNALTAEMEIGGPMASLYILGHPDHYTNHSFVLFYWENFIRSALRNWNDDFTDLLKGDLDDDKVMLNKQQDKLVGISKVDDYIYRPVECSDMCLYDWVRLSRKSKKQHRRTESDYNDSDDE